MDALECSGPVSYAFRARSGRRFDAHVIQSIVGHSDVATTRGYQYVDLTLQRAALSNLGGGVLM